MTLLNIYRISRSGTTVQQIIDPVHVPSKGDYVAIHNPNTEDVGYSEIKYVQYDFCGKNFCDNSLTINAFVI